MVCIAIDDQHGSPNLKEMLILPRYREKDRFTVRQDSVSANKTVVRLLHSLASILGLKIASGNERRPYMQSGPIKLELLVRPPKQVSKRDMVWKHTRSLHGIVEVDCQRLCVIDGWMADE